MTNSPKRAPVVVGIDGSLRARRAVHTAAHIAARRDRSLRIVFAVPASPRWLGPRTLSAEDIDSALREAVDLAEECLEPEDVYPVRVTGDPVDVLVEESQRAELIVLGNRGRGSTTSALFGSVGVDVAARAACPVLLMRGGNRVRVATEDPAPIVVGVEVGAGDEHTLAVAFAIAEEEHAPLVAVHTWTTPVIFGPDGAAPLYYDHGERPADELALVEATLAPLQRLHPTVPVAKHVVEFGASLVLAQESVDARLLVVGSRGRGAVAGLILGSVSQDVIHHAHCPVLIVPAAVHQPVG